MSPPLVPPLAGPGQSALRDTGTLRVAQLTASVSRQAGGLLPIVQRISRILHERGMDVSVLGLADSFTEQDRGGWGPLSPTTLRALPPRAFGYAPGLRRALLAAEADLVHIHGIWMYPSWANLSWSTGTGRPYLVSPHGMLDPWALAHSRLRKRVVAGLYENRHLRRAGCLHALAPSELTAMRKYGLDGPIAIVPNAVDPAAPPSGRIPAWQSEIGSDRKVLLFLGRLHPKKGLMPLLRSLDRLWRDNAAGARSWTLAVAGWDQNDHRRELETFVRERDLQERVRFLGPLHGQDKTDALHAADAFILPSRSEGLPVAVLEAWAHGLPVAMTDACNIDQGFSSDAAVRIALTPEDDLTGLEALFEMSAEGRHQMGERGRQLVDREFRWERIGDQFLALYRWLLREGPRPGFVEGNR